MSFEQLLSIIFNISLWEVLKLFIILALVIYLIFAIVVIRQVKVMTSTFRTGFETTLKLVSWIHLGLVLAILVLAIIIL